MCLGGGGDSTVTQKAAPKTPEEIEAIKLGLESMRLRNKFLPALMEQFGYGQDMSGNLMKLPPSAEQQAREGLAQTSYAGAQDAARVIRQRMTAAQDMIPGLMRSVQASMAPGTFLSTPMATASTPRFDPTWSQSPGSTLPIAPPVGHTNPSVPASPNPGPSAPPPPTGEVDPVSGITNLYRTLLGREPDQAGLDSWLNSGMSLDQIRDYIMESPEYRAKQGPPASSS